MEKRYRLQCDFFIKGVKRIATSTFNYEPTEKDIHEFYNNINSSVKSNIVDVVIYYEMFTCV